MDFQEFRSAPCYLARRVRRARYCGRRADLLRLAWNSDLRDGGAMADKRAASKTSAGRKRRGGRQSSPSGRRTGRRWSRQVTEHSDALTLEKGVFTSRDPKRIAASLKRSAERSRRRKG